ncbi:hypothetical protein EV426DRAFT_612346 [Tirmania nivea]|nr:hypothetical protein EV426DRAFT_612346 [Tirmania nivea]
MRGFLSAWNENDATSVARHGFLISGARENIDLWIPQLAEIPITAVEVYKSQCNVEVCALLVPKDSILRNSRRLNNTNSTSEQDDDCGPLPSRIGDMQELVRKEAPLVWQILSSIAIGPSLAIESKKNKDMMIFSAFMVLLYAKNQQINSYQTQIGVFMKACHIICCSEKHIHNTMKKVANLNKKEIHNLVKRTAFKSDIDNINKKVSF